MRLDLPVTIDAGTPAEARLIAAGPIGTPVTVLIIGGFGAVRLTGVLDDGTAVFPLPARAVETTGQVTVIATAGTEAVSAAMRVEPGPVVEPVVPLLGARSIEANGTDRAMVAAIPEDRYGNLQPDNTVVGVSIRRENGERAVWESRVKGGVAWSWIPAGLEAGLTLVATGVGAAGGPAAYLQEVPGSPAQVLLSAGRSRVPADGRSLVTVETGELDDRYGNRLLDGTAVVFTMTGPDGTRSLASAATAGGRAATIIQAPEVPGSMTVRAAAGGTISDPLIITFHALVAAGELPVDFSFSSDTLVVTVGPITGTEGAYVPDGTRVAAAAPGYEAACHTLAGRCRLEIPIDVTGELRVSASGRDAISWIGGRP
jgi:hypothetical protein